MAVENPETERLEHRDVVVDERVQNEYIIDTDFHLEVSEETLADEYIEDARVAEKVSQFGTPPEARLVSGTSLQYSNHEPTSNTFHGEALTADEIRRVLDDFGIDAVTITPTNHLPFHLTNYPKLSSEVARAYNDYLLDQVIDVDQGIYANLAVPYWEPEVAAEEIDRVGSEPGIVAGHSFQVPKLWGRPELDPIFEALTDHNLPLILHIGSLSAGNLIDDQMQVWLENLMTGIANNLIANVVSMVANGVFDRYPDLNVVFEEAGSQWIPYVANRMDDQYQGYPKDMVLSTRMYEDEMEYLDRMPSEYIFDNMYTTTQPIALPKRSDEAKAVLKSCHAEEMFMFSTDWPHHATDATNWLFEQPGIDDDLRTRISHETVEEAYDLP
jgi:predicted TIM-barrel fold metal-dependent hydrolase